MKTDQQGSISGTTSEVTHLNINSLDVQELERRLELAAASEGGIGGGDDEAAGPCWCLN